MSGKRRETGDRMLAAYGARLHRWPAGRADGLWALLTSAAFRRRFRAERALDQAIDTAAPAVDEARLENRLLAAMGVAEKSPRPKGFGLGLATAMAAASICFGLVIGGLYGEMTLGTADYAGLSESAWGELAEDGLMEAEDAG